MHFLFERLARTAKRRPLHLSLIRRRKGTLEVFFLVDRIARDQFFVPTEMPNVALRLTDNVLFRRD